MDDAPCELDMVSRRIILHARDSVRRKLATLAKPCRCAHEDRQRDFTDAGGDVTSQRFVLEVLCPEAAREGYPNCAHVESYGRDPDPFGKEIRMLSNINVLDTDSWHRWLEDMRFEILHVDNAIGHSVHGGTTGQIVPLPENATPESLQEPNLVRLRAAGNTLLAIMNEALGQDPEDQAV